ncbi:MAG TPA: ABC transporter ATP-binding protein [Anaerolineales bacterium]|nr:ABC transporter ATP-binding protein [Anaerolineales bacterium]
MATIELKNVVKKFGEKYAVKPMNMTIHDGEFVVLLGPSGCGKTTTLRMISGLETVSSGNIYLNGQDVTWAHPSNRDIAYVFQFYALYPHLNVWQNIAFTLQAQSVKKEEIVKRVRDVAALLKIKHLLKRYPGGLSGGDQQRVALARALVRRPAAFLMDEPLGALDADFRETMRAEIKHLHITQKATTVYVTHDQIEAMAMGDRIVVMSDAAIQQIGTPAEVYHDPANLFVANFIGSPGMNVVKGHYQAGKINLPGGCVYTPSDIWQARIEKQVGDDQDVILGFRPEAARVVTQGQISAEVFLAEMNGSYMMLDLHLSDEVIVRIRTSRGSYSLGTKIHFDLDPQMVRFFHPMTEAALVME